MSVLAQKHLKHLVFCWFNPCLDVSDFPLQLQSRTCPAGGSLDWRWNSRSDSDLFGLQTFLYSKPVHLHFIYFVLIYSDIEPQLNVDIESNLSMSNAALWHKGLVYQVDLNWKVKLGLFNWKLCVKIYILEPFSHHPAAASSFISFMFVFSACLEQQGQKVICFYQLSRRVCQTHLNKLCSDHVRITTECVCFLNVLLRCINMWKHGVPVNLFDLWPLFCVSDNK